jgi:hypothetical protein
MLYNGARWDEREVEMRIGQVFALEYGLSPEEAVKTAQMDHHAWELEWGWFLQEVQLLLDALDEGFGWGISCQGNGGSFLVHEASLDAEKLVKAVSAGTQPVKVAIESSLSRLVVKVWLLPNEEPDEVYVVRPTVDEAIWLPEITVEAAS